MDNPPREKKALSATIRLDDPRIDNIFGFNLLSSSFDGPWDFEVTVGEDVPSGLPPFVYHLLEQVNGILSIVADHMLSPFTRIDICVKGTNKNAREAIVSVLRPHLPPKEG